MKLIIKIKDKEICVCAGKGGQTLRWACISACQRYCQQVGMFTEELEPIFLFRETNLTEPLEPYSRIASSGIKDGEHFRLIVTGEEGKVQDMEPFENSRVMNPFDFDDIRAFSSALSLILLSGDYSDLISWSKSLRSLVIRDSSEFSRIVMPKYLPYTNIDQFCHNLQRVGFVPSYPPPGRENEPKYKDDPRLEFVHSFATPEISSSGKEEVVRAAVSHFKKLLNGIRNSPSAKPKQEPTSLENAQLRDRQLQNLLSIVKNGPAFEDFFTAKLGLVKLLPKESPFEDLAVCRQILLTSLPIICALYRYAVYRHGTAQYLTAGEYIQSLKEIGVVNNEPNSAKDAEMSFLEANMAPGTAGATDTVRQMILDEYIGSLFRLSVRKYNANCWTLARSFEELMKVHLLPFGEHVHDDDYSEIAWMTNVIAREDVHRVLIELGPQTRDSYYSCAAPDAWLNFDKLRNGLGKSRLAPLCADPGNHATMIKRSFLLSSATCEPAPTTCPVLSPVTQDMFASILVLMAHLIAQILSRQGQTKQPPSALIPLANALSTLGQQQKAGGEEGVGVTATAIRYYIEAALEDIVSSKSTGKKRGAKK